MKSNRNILGISCLVAGALLASLNVQAAGPTINYAIKMEITYTGTLYSSTDGVNWTEVAGASSPYYISMEDSKKLFFCSRGEAPEPKPGENFTASLPGGVELDLNWIKAGTFIMGSPADELGRESDEVQHEVTLTQDYWMGKYEVTQAQYEAVMGTNPSKFTGADLPVEEVTWDDAMEFCTKLTAIGKASGKLPEGYEFTLPTEAQWEYACRAGTTTALNSGKNLSDKWKCPEMDEVGWYGYNSGGYDSDGNWTENGKTFPVGQKKPNAWGLYDMHGNVYEWCLDWKGAYPTSSVTDPKGPATGSARVLRGGGWRNRARYCRSASRGSAFPDSYDYSRGFRVALSLVQ